MLTWWLMGTPAMACGGLFCDQGLPVPVVQNAERVVFAIDTVNEQVDMHTQVFYEGDPAEFAWIVPVPAEPQLFLSNQALFDELTLPTAPRFRLNRVAEGRCQDTFELSVGLGGSELSLSGGATPEPIVPTGVAVVSQRPLGPYQTEVLLVRSQDDFLAYLDKRGYDVPAGLAEALAPYVVETGTYFVALRLDSDADAGDITPLGLTYSGTDASIPIQLTAVAAVEDMPLEIYVFGDRPAVPLSYLHVRPNHAAIDWFQGGVNYYDVVAEAVDEAGGRAFVTDYIGDPSDLVLSLTYAFQPDALAGSGSAEDWLAGMREQRVPRNAQTASVLSELFDLGSVDPLEFYDCPTCVRVNTAGFDAVAATTLLQARVLEPLERIESLLGYGRLTRLATTMSPAEMTVDPTFTLADTGELRDPFRVADLVSECGYRKPARNASRRLELADGRTLSLPSTEWMSRNGETVSDLLADVGQIRAQVVEQYGRDGQSEVLVDHTATLMDLSEVHNQSVRELVGGCQTGPSAPGWVLLVGALAVARRRSDYNPLR